MSYTQLDKGLREKLIETRFTIGAERQSCFAAELTALMDILKKEALDPFDCLPHLVYDRLNSACDHFKEGGHWDCADIYHRKYFYRIESMPSFYSRNEKFFYTNYDDDGLLLSPDTGVVKDKFLAICEDYEKKGNSGWLPLKRVVSGYFSYRNFSWWTNDYDFDSEAKFPQSFYGADLSAEQKWAVEFAGKVGVVNDWLCPQVLFMRLDSEKIDPASIRVPSVIDALLQPIFSPRKDPLLDKWGLAFDLNDTLAPAYREFVLKNVEADAIEYFPIQLDERTFKIIRPGAYITKDLVEALISNI